MNRLTKLFLKNLDLTEVIYYYTVRILTDPGMILQLGAQLKQLKEVYCLL